MSGISSSRDIFMEAAPRNTPIEQKGADFFGLLFLMLTPLSGNVPLEAAELSHTTTSEAAGGTAAALQTERIDVLNDTSCGDAHGIYSAPSENSQGLDDAISTSETHFPQRLALDSEAAALDDIIKVSGAIHTRKDEVEHLMSVSQTQLSSSKNSLLQDQNLNQALGERRPSTATGPREFLSIDDLPNGSGMTKLPKSMNNDETQIYIGSGTEEIPARLEIEPAELRSDPHAYRIPETSDSTTFQDPREARGFGTLNRASSQAISAPSDLRAPASALDIKHIVSGEDASKFVQRARLQDGGEPISAVQVETQIAPQAHVSDARGRQGYFPQNKEDEVLPEMLQSAVDGPFEDPSRGATSFQVAHAQGRVPLAAPRDPQPIHWPAVIDRLGGEIRGQIRIGKQEAVLQLDPPQLGKLKIDLSVDGDKLAARIFTETEQSRALIELHLPELRQALGESRVELVEVRIDSSTWTGLHDNGRQTQQEGSEWRQTPQTFESPMLGDSELVEPPRRITSTVEAGRVSMWA
jgi:flagellar hook-length control protein FliK